jgi:hypothetical protein
VEGLAVENFDRKRFIEAFAKLRELSVNMNVLSTIDDKTTQKSLIARSGELLTELFDDHLRTSDSETSVELNFAVLKFRHSVKRSNPPR